MAEQKFPTVDLSRVHDNAVRTRIVEQLNVFLAGLQKAYCVLAPEYDDQKNLWRVYINDPPLSSADIIKHECSGVERPRLYNTVPQSVEFSYSYLLNKLKAGQYIMIREKHCSLLKFDDEDEFNSWFEDYAEKGLKRVVIDREPIYRVLVDAEFIRRLDENWLIEGTQLKNMLEESNKFQ